MSAAGSIPYTAPGWRYLIGAHNHTPGFEAPAFDDSGWSIGTGPFGGGGEPYDSGDSLIIARNTVWVGNLDLLTRKTFAAVPGRYRFELGVAADETMIVYLNGEEVLPEVTLWGTVGGIGRTVTDWLVTTFEATLAATNVLAVRTRDTGGGGSYSGLRLEWSPVAAMLVGAVAIG